MPDDYDFEDEDDAQGTSCMGPDGPRVLSRQCATCILRPGNLMHLQPGRLAQLMADATREGCQGMICHDTLAYGENPDFGPALCRGWFDKYGARSNFVRVMERIGGFTEVEPPEGGHDGGTTA